MSEPSDADRAILAFADDDFIAEVQRRVPLTVHMAVRQVLSMAGDVLLDRRAQELVKQGAAAEEYLRRRAASITKPLTAAQAAELRNLAGEPQHTYGSGRARVQNNLVRRGYARWEDNGGAVASFISSERCGITQIGREHLATLGDAPKKRGRR